jgi:hypothetical protein
VEFNEKQNSSHHFGGQIAKNVTFYAIFTKTSVLSRFILALLHITEISRLYERY